MSTKGKIKVDVENIFPLIKKFLYSDHEIFLRELVSNATDATLKLKHLTSTGKASVEYGSPMIEIKIDLREARSNKPVATGSYYQASLKTKSSEEVIRLILTPLFRPSK